MIFDEESGTTLRAVPLSVLHVVGHVFCFVSKSVLGGIYKFLFIWDGILLLEGERIHSFGAERELEIPSKATVIDAKGAYVGPGFVDIHVHEGGRYPTYYEPAMAAEYFLRHGTTSLLATPYYSMTFDEIMRALRTVREAMGKVRTLKGICMEAPILTRITVPTRQPILGACP